jgi:uncharacterized protein
MRVVIDTNLLISALIKPLGKTGVLIRHLRDGNFVPLYSNSSLEELSDVINRPRIQDKYGISTRDIETLLRLMILRGEHVTPNIKIQACRDPKDNKFLEIAITASADAIVSGDGDLLDLHSFQNIPILTTSQFLDQINPPSQ